MAANRLPVSRMLSPATTADSSAAGAALGADAYRLYRAGHILLIEGGDARGALYGAFALLREIAEEHSLAVLDEHSEPWAAVRWTNEWDNPDGQVRTSRPGHFVT